MKALRLLVLITVIAFASCARVGVYQGAGAPPIIQAEPVDSSRLLFYIHIPSSAPPNIEFKITGVELERMDGRTSTFEFTPLAISSLKLVGAQVKVLEAFAEPGAYKGMWIIVSEASIKWSAGEMASLSLPEPEGRVYVSVDLALGKGSISVVSLEWTPEESIEKRYIFKPDIEVMVQMPTAKEVLVFVANSGDNYISMIDRVTERVIAALRVGRKPTAMALNRMKDTLYVLNSGDRTISEIDTVHFNVRTTFDLSTGIGPEEVVYVPDKVDSNAGKLYVMNRSSSDLTVINAQTRRILRTITVGTNPSHIASDAARREIYVANEASNDLTIINADTDSVIFTIKVGIRPKGIAIGDDKIYVFNEGSRSISVISSMERRVMFSIPTLEPPQRGIKAFNQRLIVLNASTNTVTFLNSSDTITRTVGDGAGPLGIVSDETLSRIYITNFKSDKVSIMDPMAEKTIKDLTVGKAPRGIAILER